MQQTDRSHLTTPCPPPTPASSLPSRPERPSLRHEDADTRQSTVRTALHKAFHLLRRSPATKTFMLTPPTPSDDLNLLASERPAFTISTEEDQLGALPGQIALRYLGIPAFPDTDGLSGGLVVTNYSKRTHPLHDPAVMSDLRVGRYVRDNHTGEWCIITRNNSDGILRLQYIHVNDHGIRERIGLTCAIKHFDKGRFQESVLFKCHDIEHKVCNRCLSPPCFCHPAQSFKVTGPLGLDSVAQAVIREGANEWVGTVHVTVVSNISNNPLLDIDDTMTVHSSYQPSFDKKLASHMRQLAMNDTISQSMNIPAPLTANDDDDDDDDDDDQKSKSASQDSTNSMLPALRAGSSHSELSHSFQQSERDKTPSPIRPPASSLPLTPPPLSPLLSTGKTSQPVEEGNQHSHNDAPVESTYPFNDLTIYDVFSGEDSETANHFLIPIEPPSRYVFEDDMDDFPMLPADPSTLPGGIGSCMDGMQVNEECDYEDDCFSLMTSDRDTGSIASALSTAGSDYAPPVDSVPLPGDDFVDAISALQLSSPHQHSDTPQHSEKPKEKWSEESDEKADLEPTVRCMSPINAPLSETSAKSMESAVDESPVKVIKTEDRLEEDCATVEEQNGSKKHDVKEEAVDKKVKKEAVSQPTPIVAPTATTPLVGGYPMGIFQFRGGPNISSHMASMIAPAVMTSVGGATVVTPMMPAMVPAMNYGQAALGIPMGMGMGVMPYHMGAWVQGSNGVAPGVTVPAMGVVPVPVDDRKGVGVCAIPGAGAVPGAVPGASMVSGAGAPKLAPRPDGVGVAEAKMAWGSAYGNQYLMKARLDAMEKERKAEERRKKNRQAAARSNARKKDLMDGIKAEIHKNKQRESALRRRHELLRKENSLLKNHLGR